MKIAVIVSHPIQHFCPQYASWSNIDGVNLKVFFGSNLGAVKYFDTNFKKEISWDNLYLTEFEHEFLNGNKTIQPTSKLDSENLNQKLDEYKPDLIIVYGYYHKLSRRAKKWAIMTDILKNDNQYKALIFSGLIMFGHFLIIPFIDRKSVV